MENKSSLIPVGKVESLILFIRGHRVMLDTDLAKMYGVQTKVLNQVVKRNRERFPLSFMFQLTQEEKTEVVTNCDHLRNLKYSANLPYAFTEHGALMLATLLNSEKAVQISIYIVEAFVRLRQIISSHGQLIQRVNDLEKKYDIKFKAVFEAIRQLMTPSGKHQRKIGFKGEE